MNNEITTSDALSTEYPLCNHRTGEEIRTATTLEVCASHEAALVDGGHGIITVDDISCFVAFSG